MSIIKVVGAIFLKDGKIFYAQRGQAKNPEVAYKYEFIGGKIESGEAPEQALKRELMEEADLNIEVLSHFYTVTHKYKMYTVELAVYLCEMLSDYNLKEHISAGWIDVNELVYDDWAPADKDILERIRLSFTSS